MISSRLALTALAGLCMLFWSGCAFQMKFVAPADKSIQIASPGDTCHVAASHFFWFFGDQQRKLDRDLENVGHNKKVRITVRQNFWEIMLNGASFGLLNLGSLKLEECD